MERNIENVHLGDMQSIMEECWSLMKNYPVICFRAGMGSGKTTFIASLCRYLGVEDNVSSPTFALINEYHFMEQEVGYTIFHMDWYRLQSIEEGINAGIDDCLQRATTSANTYCFVEWPEKAEALIPAHHLSVAITVASPDTRDFILQAPFSS